MALNWYILRVHNGQEEQIRESLEKRVNLVILARLSSWVVVT